MKLPSETWRVAPESKSVSCNLRALRKAWEDHVHSQIRWAAEAVIYALTKGIASGLRWGITLRMRKWRG